MPDERLTDASILVVDDQEANVRLLERLLRREGYTRVRGIMDPRDAVAQFTELAPDLVILDLTMPFLDGFAVLDLLRPLVPVDTYLPILVVTANIMPEVKRRALAAGAHDFLAKPLDAMEVLLRVRNLLETRRLHCLLRAQNAALEAEVRGRATLLLQAEKLATMGELLGGVAHELNNPLSVILGQAHLLAATLGPGPERERAVKVKDAAVRCGRIMRNFLEMARQRPPERARVGLNEVVRDAVAVLGHLLHMSEVELVTELVPGEPMLYADGHQLHQVVVNLVNNARQALAAWDGGRQVTVTTRIVEGGRAVSLEVADSGPGVPRDIRERVFDAFFTTKPVGEGTGLGLSLCRGIVEAHGGQIRLDSEPGAGARFTVELPIGGDKAIVAPGTDEVLAVAALAILVVDDDPNVADSLADLLRYDGHRVDICHGGRAALEQVDRREYDLIFVDLRMPDMDGTRLYAALGQHTPPLDGRVVFCSGDTMNPASAAFLEGTGAPVLNKPFTMGAVARVMHRHAARSASGRVEGAVVP